MNTPLPRCYRAKRTGCLRYFPATDGMAAGCFKNRQLIYQVIYIYIRPALPEYTTAVTLR